MPTSMMMTGVGPTFSSGLSSPILSLSPYLWLSSRVPTSMWQDTGRTTQASANADVIGSWDDMSGNGRHFQQSDGTKKPTLRTAQRNGKPVIRFDGVNDYLQCISSAATFNFLHDGTDYTIITAYKMSTVSATFYWLLDNTILSSSISSREGAYLRLDFRTGSGFTDALVHVVTANSSPSVVNNVNNINPSGQWGVISVESNPDNATVAERSNIQLNNGSNNKNNASTGTVVGTTPDYQLCLGAAAGDFAGNAPMDIGEMIIFPLLSASNKAKVINWLRSPAAWGSA